MLIRSILFNFFLYLWTILLGVVFLPYLFTPSHYLRQPAKLWVKGIFYLLKFICNITYEFRGINNIPKTAVIAASKHQSAFETLALFFYLEKSIFIHKKELFYIPIFGLYLKKYKMISINRKQGTKAIRKMLNEVKKRIIEGNSIIIFPEGTRKKPGELPDYKTGIAGIYIKAETFVLPIAVNSGYYWPKHSFIKKPGKIIIKFLELIPPKLEKKIFLKKIELVIEQGTKEIS